MNSSQIISILKDIIKNNPTLTQKEKSVLRLACKKMKFKMTAAETVDIINLLLTLNKEITDQINASLPFLHVLYFLLCIPYILVTFNFYSYHHRHP